MKKFLVYLIIAVIVIMYAPLMGVFLLGLLTYAALGTLLFLAVFLLGEFCILILKITRGKNYGLHNQQ